MIVLPSAGMIRAQHLKQLFSKRVKGLASIFKNSLWIWVLMSNRIAHQITINKLTRALLIWDCEYSPFLLRIFQLSLRIKWLFLWEENCLVWYQVTFRNHIFWCYSTIQRFPSQPLKLRTRIIFPSEGFLCQVSPFLNSYLHVPFIWEIKQIAIHWHVHFLCLPLNMQSYLRSWSLKSNYLFQNANLTLTSC